jgi:hypothetical protein
MPFSAANDNICSAMRVLIVLVRLGDASDPSGNSINFESNLPFGCRSYNLWQYHPLSLTS